MPEQAALAGSQLDKFGKSVEKNPIEFGGSLISGVINTIVQSRAADISSQFEANQSNFNADVAILQAQDALRIGTIQQTRLGEDIQRVVGSQVSAAAAQGLDINVGSPADIVQQTQDLGFEDQQSVAHDAALQGWGLRQQARQYRTQARIAKIQGGLTSGSTLATGGMQAIDKSLKFYDRYK